MSADNWGICPKCKAGHEARLKDNEKFLVEQYGKVDQEAYKILQQRFAAVPTEYDTYELREDYELSLSEYGNVYISYSAHCYNDECDFTYNFHHEETIDV